MTAGFDVSHAQDILSLEEWKQAYDALYVPPVPPLAEVRPFVWLRASWGLNEDLAFEANWPRAKAAGFRRGAYHVLHPDQNIGDQAALFSKLAMGGELPPGLDLEWSPPGQPERWNALKDPYTRVAVCQDWIAQVQENINQASWIYTSQAFVAQFFPEDHKLGRNKLWLACYRPEVRVPQDLPAGWANYAAWQKGQGKIPGIGASVDLDYLKEEAL